jgi:tetratricopeptide (TPR) repeat protein
VIEGRAFLGLCQVDRALMRAREAHEAAPDDKDALRLLAEVYLARGWPVRARKPLDALKVLGDLAPELWARVAEVPPRPEVGAREIERDGDAAALLALAEAFLLTGSTLRATGILERLRRSDPGNGRVAELLWGIAGDFTSGARDLADYAAPVPQVSSLTLLPTSATTDFEEEAAHTESVKLDQALVEDSPAEGAFPALFKHVEIIDDREDDGIEPTLSSVRPAPPPPDEGNDRTGGTNTVVRAVVAHRTASNRIHAPKDGDPAEIFDLRAWQESHGMDLAEGTSDLGDARGPRHGEIAAREVTSDIGDARAPGQRPAAPVRLGPAGVIEDTANDRMESEDAHVVVLRQGPPAPAESPRLFHQPIEVVEKFPEPPRAAPRPSVPASVPPRLPLRPVPPPAKTRSLAWLAVPVAVAGALVVAVIAWAWSSGGPTARLRGDLLATLATLDYAAYVEQETELQGAGDSVAVGAALAELRIATWTEFSSEPSRVGAARDFLAAAEALDPRRRAMLRSSLALGEGDVQAARAALGRPTPEDDEDLLLVARVLCAAGDADAAREALRVLGSKAPRYAIGKARVLAALGDPTGARAALQALSRGSDMAAARLLFVETPERAKTPAERVAAADIFLRDFSVRGLPPAYEARAQVARANGYQELGLPERAREAVAEGLRHDGANSALLALDAADAALAQSLLTAESTLARARAGRPGDAALRAAHVGLLLDMDRVEDDG